MHAPSSSDRLTNWQNAVRAAGIKLTHQRLEVFRELAGRDEHPDAESIFRAVRERVPTISLDTVYRTLWLLYDLGLVSTLGPRRDSVRFDVNMSPHHHFCCVRCGLVRDFTDAALDALPLPSQVHALGDVLAARVEVHGVCQACAAPNA